MVFGSVHRDQRTLHQLDGEFHWTDGIALDADLLDQVISRTRMTIIADEMPRRTSRFRRELVSAQRARHRTRVCEVDQRLPAEQAVGFIGGYWMHFIRQPVLPLHQTGMDRD